MSPSRILLAVAVIVLAAGPAVARAAPGDAPGRPGAKVRWSPADKDGFGTAAGRRSKVWFTLRDGGLSEVYWPDLGTPSVHDLQFVVTDGHRLAERESRATRHVTRLTDPRSLTFRQEDVARSGAYRIGKTYASDPARDVVLIHVDLASLTRRPLRLFALLDPSLGNHGMHDTGTTERGALIVRRRGQASALVASSGWARTSQGFLGRSDGWRELRRHHRLVRTYTRARDGNVVQTGATRLTGLRGHRSLTLALAFGRTAAEARRRAHASLRAGFARTSRAYAAGWHRYGRRLRPPPASAAAFRGLYDASVLTLAASEDKAHRGAFVASPSMPWAFGTGLEKPISGSYHLVWARDLYQIATALLAAGDRSAAERALAFLLDHQQKRDGSFPQNSTVTGRPHWTGLQLDEVALPIVLAAQLHRHDAATWRHVRRAANVIVRKGPASEQERWENQSGTSPATLAAEIAGLVSAADIARRNSDPGAARRYDRVADRWQRSAERWTATATGPYRPRPYYLRLTKRRDPDAGTTYALGDGGPKAIDQRRVVDPSFLELVRLGVKAPGDRTVLNTLRVVDAHLRVATPFGPFWHRYTQDGYGETRAGGPWDTSPDGSHRTLGRAWPLLAGERGEYELAAGDPGAARALLATMAGAASPSRMLSEQVWDGRVPTGRAGFAAGTGTTSATPLAWTHAQFVRLAWSIQAGRPVERPVLTTCRYVLRCR